MKRSVGVTIAAIVMLVLSSLTLLFWILAAYASERNGPLQDGRPRPPLAMLMVVLAFYGAASLLGIFTAAGLLRLKNWARISTLVFSGFALSISIMVVAICFVMPIPAPPNSPPNFLQSFRLTVALLAAAPAAISLWWLIYFCSSNVQAQFHGVAGSESPRARPPSLSIIGWYLTICGIGTLPGTLIYRTVLFLIWILHGWSAIVFAAALAAWTLISGIGVLKLRRWGLISAVTLQFYWILSTAVIIVNPGIISRLMTLMRPDLPLPPPLDVTSFMRAITAFSIVLICVILWFLIRSRGAFKPASGDSSALLAEN